MMRSGLLAALGAVVLVAAVVSGVAAQTGTLKILVAYCPTDFTSAGAVVTVDPMTGDYTIDGTFKWPNDAVFGCAADYDPIVSYDPDSQLMYMDFVSDDGVIVGVDMNKAEVSVNFNTKDLFFTGYENFQATADGKALMGISGTVTEHGPCDDGCFSFGNVDLSTEKYAQSSLLLYKAVQDDVHFYDSATNTYWVQMSHQLMNSGPMVCPGADSCLLAIDAATGNVTSSVLTTYEVYKWGSSVDANGNIGAWMFGFENMCEHPYEDFLFGSVNLNTGVATPSHCISKNTTVVEDEWISSFSADGTLFATGSGDTDSGSNQLLVFDVASGATLLNSDLAGLPQALKSAQNLMLIWAVQFV